MMVPCSSRNRPGRTATVQSTAKWKRKKSKGSRKRRAVTGLDWNHVKSKCAGSSQKSSAGDRDVGIGVGVTLIGQLPAQQVGSGPWPHRSSFLS